MTGHCDCGATFEVASRFDHDGDTGQCWECSDRSLLTMSEQELHDYLRG